jgi:hypothetical protein
MTQISLNEKSNEEANVVVFSVQFAWAENHRFFYEVVVIGGPERTFTVWVDGVQEGKWGIPVPTNGREIIGTCQKPVEKWCHLNLDQLPLNGETKQIFLNGTHR